MVASEKVIEPLRNGSGRFVHGFTNSGTPLSCFVGFKVFELMQREGLFTRGEGFGAYLINGLQTLAERHEAIGEVRGKGLLLGVEFVADRQTHRPFPKNAAFWNPTPHAVNSTYSNGDQIGSSGSGDPHNKMPPAWIVNKLIKL